jgi:hypothetical protein
LNYTVLLNETLEASSEALELAKSTYAECNISIQEISDNPKADASMLLDILYENMQN